MEKLKNLLSVWVSGHDCDGKEKRRPENITLFMIREMQFVYTALKLGQKAYFVESNLIPYLEDCGVNIIIPQGNEIVYTAWIE